MQTRKFIPILTAFVALSLCASAELVDNGDFKKDLPYWRLFRHHGYVPQPVIKRIDGGLEFTKLSFLTHYYYSLSTAVKIKEGVKYTLSYDIKGPATKHYFVRLGDPGDTNDENVKPVWHYFGANLSVPTDWQTITVPFVGKFDTQTRWYTRVRLARKNNKINKDGWARAAREKAALVKVDASDRPCVSSLDFFFGQLEGQVSIRNVSIVEEK
jgi:hypothetical protein